jgi:hypothetical protein
MPKKRGGVTHKPMLKDIPKKLKSKPDGVSQAEWADEFARQHKATIGAKKKPRTKQRAPKPQPKPQPKPRSMIKKTVTKVTKTRRTPK